MNVSASVASVAWVAQLMNVGLDYTSHLLQTPIKTRGGDFWPHSGRSGGAPGPPPARDPASVDSARSRRE